MSKVAVYTAIAGKKDILKEKQNTKGADFIAYLDPLQQSSTWEVRPLIRREFDPNRNAKPYKILPHKYLPEYEYSLWIDGSITLNVPVQTLIDKYLEKTDIAMFKHPTRKNIHEEGVVVAQHNMDNPLIVQEQLIRYKNAGYPSNGYKMGECTIMLRRHNTKQMIDFNNEWWEEIDKGSRRDQLSFGYLLWKHKLPVTWIEGSVEKLEGRKEFVGNKYFTHERHLR